MDRPATPLILLIEDDDDDLFVTFRALRRAGSTYDVKVIRDGCEALRFINALQGDVARGAPLPCAVFLDLRLPGADGKRILREIRSHEATQDLPVIVVSSTTRDVEIEECYRLGANSFISKRYGGPDVGQYLVQAMRRWVEPGDLAPESAPRHERGMNP